MEFKTNSHGIHIQFIPTYGMAAGFLYYNPNLEPSLKNVDLDDFYEQVTILILFFGIPVVL